MKRDQAYSLRQAGDMDAAASLEASATILERSAERMARCSGERPGAARPLAHVHGSTAIERAAGEAPEHEAADSVPSCNDEERTILAAIRQHHRGDAITAQDLGALIERDSRAVRAIVSHLRAEHGVPICSAAAHRRDEPAGYYWPARPEDADATLAQLESRRIEIEAAVTGMRTGLRRTFGTLALFGDVA